MLRLPPSTAFLLGVLALAGGLLALAGYGQWRTEAARLRAALMPIESVRPSWLPFAVKDVQYVELDDRIVFEGTLSRHLSEEAFRHLNRTLLDSAHPVRIDRWPAYAGSAYSGSQTALDPDFDHGAWLSALAPEIRHGWKWESTNGSRLVYDFETGQLYGNLLQGDLREIRPR